LLITAKFSHGVKDTIQLLFVNQPFFSDPFPDDLAPFINLHHHFSIPVGIGNLKTISILVKIRYERSGGWMRLDTPETFKWGLVKNIF
jgi:hypothetical protein